MGSNTDDILDVSAITCLDLIFQFSFVLNLEDYTHIESVERPLKLRGQACKCQEISQIELSITF